MCVSLSLYIYIYINVHMYKVPRDAWATKGNCHKVTSKHTPSIPKRNSQEA